MIAANTATLAVLGALGGSVLLLMLWRLFTLPGFSWAALTCVLGVVAVFQFGLGVLNQKRVMPRTTDADAALAKQDVGQPQNFGAAALNREIP
jgi:hypothetical protein